MNPVTQDTIRGQNRIVMAIQVLGAIGFDHVNILKALPKLSGLSHPEIAKRLGISRQSVTLTLNCARTNKDMQARIAEAFSVPVEIMFPENTVV